MPVASSDAICANCATSSSDLIDVRKRNLCRACFIRYVATKVHKCMESYDFKNQVGDQPHKLLLPLSGGPSSIALLNALDVQLQVQMKNRNKCAFNLVLVHVKYHENDEQESAFRQNVQKLFPNHEFLPTLELQDILRQDSNIEHDLARLGLVRNKNEDDNSVLIRLFACTKTATAKSDLQEILLHRLLVTVAKSNSCQGILWGHSDSRLAAKTLADVAKGRGGSVSNAISDGPSPWGIVFRYPLRMLYTTELEQYIRCQSNQLAGCLINDDIDQTPISVRNTSIDALLNGYIASQSQKYPNLVTNVVRTTGKLQIPPAENQRCILCSMPSMTMPIACDFCYGCNRMKQDIKI